jgi:hypothetical protein
MNEEKLTADVAATAASVADWKSRIAGLETQTAQLNDIITKATAHRENSALSSLLGSVDAKNVITRARFQQREAEEEIADISRYAIPAARESLAEAERFAQAAHTALSHYKAGLAKRRRIGLSAKINDMLAALVPLIEEWDAVGAEIANTPGLYAQNMFGSGMSELDEIIGNRRLRAALPARFEKIFPGAMFDEKRKESLLDSEVRIWNLPPEQPEQKAA